MRERLTRILFAVRTGVSDGFAEPWDLGSGYTWNNDDTANNIYDHAANFGQTIGRLVKRS